MPSEKCQSCGHPIVDPNGTAPTSTYYDPSPTASANAGVPLDDVDRLARLLDQIAAQSHFEERYVIQSELARGGMGQVYRAFDRILRREVAIKMMYEGRGGTPAVMGQFLKEARVGGRLLHPNILAVFDLGVTRTGRIYFTMRLVDGASLQHSLDALDRGAATNLIAYPLRKVVEAFVGACQGVDFAHQQGVIHLDLKPQNVLVSEFKEVFVIDWGLARVDETDDTEAMADLYRGGATNPHAPHHTGWFGDRVVGTPVYMSPEQASGRVGTFAPTTDVYGLGGILYYILYGDPPNRGSDVGRILAACSERKNRGKLRSGVLPRGQRVRKEVRSALDALEAICLKALEPDPDDRYPTVEAMTIELNEWLASTPGPPHGL
jgi:serine/threonine-protein kinase